MRQKAGDLMRQKAGDLMRQKAGDLRDIEVSVRAIASLGYIRWAVSRFKV